MPLRLGTLHVKHITGSPVVTITFKTLLLGLHHLCNLHFPGSWYKPSRPGQPAGLGVHQICPSFLPFLRLFPPCHPISASERLSILQTPILQGCFSMKSSEKQHITGLLLRTSLVRLPHDLLPWNCLLTGMSLVVGRGATGGQGSCPFYPTQSSAQCLF